MDFVRSDIQKISSSKGKGRSTAANIDKINESFQVFALVVKKAEDSGPVLNTIIIPILTELLGHLENPKLQQSLDPSAMLTILQVRLLCLSNSFADDTLVMMPRRLKEPKIMS